jgi:hypothetical protein
MHRNDGMKILVDITSMVLNERCDKPSILVTNFYLVVKIQGNKKLESLIYLSRILIKFFI